MATPKQLEARLTSHGYRPPTHGAQPGVSTEVFAGLERVVGAPLIKPVRDLYRYSAHPFDGWLDPNGEPMPPLLDRGHAFLPWDRIEQRWQMQRDLEKDSAELAGCMGVEGEPVKRGVFNAAWIPVATDDTGDYIMVDMDPGPAGTVGQLILRQVHGFDTPLCAPSIPDYFDFIIHALDNGIMAPHDGGWMNPKTGSRSSISGTRCKAALDAGLIVARNGECRRRLVPLSSRCAKR